MNGAESLVRTLVVNGVNVCFTNPGTSEMHFVAALDKVEDMRCVLGMFEGGRATTLEELAVERKGAFARRGPYLVEVVL